MNTVDTRDYAKRLRGKVLDRAASYDAAGETIHARTLLTNVIRNDNWSRATLWWRLVALMKASSDYQHIRDLWTLSPTSCRDNQSIVRAVARAAAVSGNHHECQLLLQRLIRLLANRRRRAAFRRLGERPRQHHTPSHIEAGFTKAAAEALQDLNSAFEGIDLKMFLISGTLLGLIREGTFIGWDKDIDVGYFAEDCHIDLESHFRYSKTFRVGRVDLTSERLRLIHKNGTWIDVFPHYLESGQRWHDGTATRWANTPFKLTRAQFIGTTQYIPEKPELYLQENYGEWRTPISTFDARLDAPNVQITDLPHFVSLLYFSIAKHLKAGEYNVASRYVEILKTHSNDLTF